MKTECSFLAKERHKGLFTVECLTKLQAESDLSRALRDPWHETKVSKINNNDNDGCEMRLQ